MLSMRDGRRYATRGMTLAAVCWALAAPAAAQVKRGPAAPPAGVRPPVAAPGTTFPRGPVGVPKLPVAPPAAKAAKGPKLPEPEDLSLETRDGVSIRATYYPGMPKTGADSGMAKAKSVPLMLVHGWEGTRGEFHAFALFLQSQGIASIAPDLRGHGQSQSQKLPNGMVKTLESDSLTRRDLEAMVLDLEACKKFLLEKNNAGEVNIEQLGVLGADLGAIVAMRWAVLDWSWPVLPAYKQGQDVKAVVLLSPPQAFKGVTIREATSHPLVRSRLSMLIVAGLDDAKATADAKRIHASLQAFHVKPTDDPDQDAERLDLWFSQPATNLQGTKLLGRGMPIPQEVALFIQRRLVNKAAEFPWAERINPLGN